MQNGQIDGEGAPSGEREPWTPRPNTDVKYTGTSKTGPVSSFHALWRPSQPSMSHIFKFEAMIN